MVTHTQDCNRPALLPAMVTFPATMSGYFSSRLALKQCHLSVSGEKQLVTSNVTHVRLDERPLPNGTDAKNVSENNAVVHCRLRPLRPAPSPSLWCQLSSRTRRGGALACARRRNDVTRCNGTDVTPYGPLCANITSSIKPEVHNISQCRQRRTDSRP